MQVHPFVALESTRCSPKWEVTWGMLDSLYSLPVCREERLHVLAVIEGEIAQHRIGHRKVGAKSGCCPLRRKGHLAEMRSPEIVYRIVRWDLQWVVNFSIIHRRPDTHSQLQFSSELGLIPIPCVILLSRWQNRASRPQSDKPMWP